MGWIGPTWICSSLGNAKRCSSKPDVSDTGWPSSDHGMVNIGDSPDKIIDLDKFLHVPIPNRLRVAACTPELQIYPDADLIPEIVQNLSAAVKQYPNIKVYRKEEVAGRM